VDWLHELTNGPAVDYILLISAVVVVIIMAHAYRGVRRLRNSLVGKRGHALTSIITTVVLLLFVQQFGAVINAALIVWDRQTTVEYRVIIFMAQNILTAAAVLYAFLKVERMAGLSNGALDRYDEVDNPQEAQTP
jgi:hypothetical protein